MGELALAFAAHGAVMLACVAGAMLLPRVASAPRDLARSPLAQLRAGVTNPVLLLLALAAALPNMVSYGTSLVAAGWLAKTHGVSLAASAGIVAGAKILAVLAGSTVTGALLARAMRPCACLPRWPPWARWRRRCSSCRPARWQRRWPG
jgi:hypothetical protein